jgi:HSP20 family protein
MSQLMPWDPTRDLLRGRFDRLFDNFFEDVFTPSLTRERAAKWAPAVDIEETENEYVFFAELPGLTKGDINVSLENGVLTISGERKFEKDVKEKDVKKENYHRIERTYGSFSRSFSLPDNVKSDQVLASFEDGILEIHLPKAEEAKPRKIEIK